MLSYPELYILGRQVDGVYVEYLHGSEQADLFSIIQLLVMKEII